MGFRKASFNEMFTKDKDNNKEVFRWHKNKPVMVDFGPEYQARLKELKEKSKELNNLIEQKIQGKSLPFSTKTERAPIFKLTFLLRPEFIQTDLPPKEKDKVDRFNPAKDEIAICIHLNEENQYDNLRRLHDPKCYMLGSVITADIEENSKEDTLDVPFDINNLEPLANFFVEKLEQGRFNENYQEITKAKYINEAKKALNNSYIFNTLPDHLIERMLKEILRNLLKELYNQFSSKNQTTLIDFKSQAQELVSQFLELEVNTINSNPAKRLISKAIINSLLKNFSDKFKKEIYKKK